jgi:hypothetical protein
MLIGVLSDSHGRVTTTRRALAMLTAAGAERVIHLGDLGSCEVIDEMAGHDAHIVLGNCDWPEEPMLRHACAMGIAVAHPRGVLDVDERRIAFTHGHIDHLVRQSIEERVAYLLVGHSHEPRDERLGSTRVINPGALFRAPRYTAALLDPGKDSLTFIEIPGRE